MKKLMIAGLLVILGVSKAQGHEGEHGPPVTDAPKYGGIVSGVFGKNGDSKDLIYKAELVRSSDGTIRVYVYDDQMKAVDLASFASDADALLISGKKAKQKKTGLKLVKKDSAYVGKWSKAPAPPYSVEVRMKAGAEDAYMEFENLD